MPGPPVGRPIYAAPGHFCRLFQSGTCWRGEECPLMHSWPAEVSTTASRDLSSTSGSTPSNLGLLLDGHDSQDDQNHWGWSWTSSASSESWSSADLSEDSRATVWTPLRQPPSVGGRASGQAVAALGAAAPQSPASGLPSFSGRITHVPEFTPSEDCPKASPQEPPAPPKSKSAARRRQRMLMEKWVTIRNGAAAAELVEAACRALSRPRPPPQCKPRTQSASPPRPGVSPASPQKHGRSCRDKNDSDDSGDDGGGSAIVCTKLSL